MAKGKEVLSSFHPGNVRYAPVTLEEGKVFLYMSLLFGSNGNVKKNKPVFLYLETLLPFSLFFRT